MNETKRREMLRKMQCLRYRLHDEMDGHDVTMVVWIIGTCVYLVSWTLKVNGVLRWRRERGKE